MSRIRSNNDNNDEHPQQQTGTIYRESINYGLLGTSNHKTLDCICKRRQQQKKKNIALGDCWTEIG